MRNDSSRSRHPADTRPGRDADPAAAEERLSGFYEAIVTAESPAWRYVLRHPGRTATAAMDIGRLPSLRAELPDSRTGSALVRTLTRRGPLGLAAGTTGMAVLEVPADPLAYREGSSKQTLRRKVRLAERKGVSWRRIEGAGDRQELLRLADAAEVAHADARYRIHQPRNDDLLDHDLWLAAFAADGTPLLLSVTPTAGEWGHLRYFRTLGSSPEHSDSRYLMTQVLVEALAARGVRYLVDGVHPVDLPNGLRHFQRMVGFRLARVTAGTAR